MLDPSAFKTSTVPKLGLAGGKGGKREFSPRIEQLCMIADISACVVYLLDMNNMGGFKNGVSNTDAVLQTILMPSTGSQPGPPYGGIFGTVASYPLAGLQGGYIYVKPTSISGAVILNTHPIRVSE